MNEEIKRGRGRPRKEEEGRERFTIRASPATQTAWQREAKRRGVSLSDLFAEIGEGFPKVVVV